ncbi:MAG: hypothetical protein NTY03_07550 [Candidatus Bathyarchaeota archaeon]|nr:hypothetical protein [Candidatus Bathyarchaeota archaeon]
MLKGQVGIEMIHWWLYISRDDLETERLQCLQEGKDLTPLLAEFGRVKKLNLKDQVNQSVAQGLLDKTISLPVRDDFPYVEPSGLEEIRAARLILDGCGPLEGRSIRQDLWCLAREDLWVSPREAC